MTTPKKKPTKRTTKTTAKKVSTASAKIEKQFDAAMADTQELIDKKVSAKTKKTVQNVSKKAEMFAGKVEHVGDEVETITDSIFPTTHGSIASFEAQYSKKVSRLFIFRFLWLILQGPITIIRCFWIMIITVIHRISMFLLGKRTKSLRKKQVRFWKHIITWKSYMNGLTDARPEIITPAI